jgi:hypothetical protein
MQWPVRLSLLTTPYMAQLAPDDYTCAAVTHIMNDDIESAEEHLSKGSSPFHQVRL